MNNLTKELLAKTLNGREYRQEISLEEIKLAEQHGLVVVFGASDDLCEFEGAICEEIGCWEGANIYFNKEGSNFTDENGEAPLTSMKNKEAPEANLITAIWGEEGYSWTYETEIPHSTFDVMEEGEKYCRGIVFDKKDLI